MQRKFKLLSAVASAALMAGATVALAQTGPTKEPQAQERPDKEKGAAGSGSAQQDRAPRNVGPTQTPPATSAQSNPGDAAKPDAQTRSQEPAGKDRATTAPGRDASDQAKDEASGQKKSEAAKKDPQDGRRDVGKKAESDKDGAKQARDRDQDRNKQDRARSERNRDQDRARSDDGKRDRDDSAERRGDDRQARDKDDRRGDRDSVSLSDRDETRIRETISRQNVRRVTNVNFNISVGTVVPRTVELYPLPAAVVEIVPEYRGYRYVLVRDEIVIVHP